MDIKLSELHSDLSNRGVNKPDLRKIRILKNLLKNQ